MNPLIDFPPLPEGYSVRPTTMDDADKVNKLYEFSEKFDGVPFIGSLEDLLSDWTKPNFVLENSHRLVFAPNGELVACVRVDDSELPPVVIGIGWCVHPDHRQLGFQEALLQWAEERAKLAIPLCPEGTQVSVTLWMNATNAFRKATAEQYGYTCIRNFNRMQIVHHEAPVVPSLPSGLALRPYRHPDHFHELITVFVDAFSEHWGHIKRPIEDDVREYAHFLDNDSKFDPNLFFLVEDTHTHAIVAFSMCRSEAWDDPESAFVLDFGVAKAYRGRGLAQFLLYHTFAEFFKRGTKSVMLNVDTGNVTGALKLYEKVGMQQVKVQHVYEKILRVGVVLQNTN